MEEAGIVKLSETGVHLLRKVLGKRLYSFYTESIKVDVSGKVVRYWATEYALGLTANKSDASFINISADYKLTTGASTTYYGFEIEESRMPLRKERLLQCGHYSEVKVLSAPMLMVELYQECTQCPSENICYDAAIVIYTDSEKYMLHTRKELIGGVDIILDEAVIESHIKNMKLRQSIV